VAVENRLSPERLAALEPGDAVTIEVSTGVGRPKRLGGTVARIVGPHVFVKVRSRHGGTYAEQYRLRDGVRVGGLARAELINAEGTDPVVDDGQRRTRQIDAAYRQWTRDRADVDKLRKLQTVIGEVLDERHLLAGSDSPSTSA
jgi:hypothetical protein